MSASCCKSKVSSMVAHCFDCDNFLCSNCLMAHQYMHRFESHRVLALEEQTSERDADQPAAKDDAMACQRHAPEVLSNFCRSCDVYVCAVCVSSDHPMPMHELQSLSEAATMQAERLSHMIEDGRRRSRELVASLGAMSEASSRVDEQYERAQRDVSQTMLYCNTVLEERRQETLRELEGAYNSRMTSLELLGENVRGSLERIHQEDALEDPLTIFSSNTKAPVFKPQLGYNLSGLQDISANTDVRGMGLEFVSNYEAIQVGVRHMFGCVKQGEGHEAQPSLHQPVHRTNDLHHTERGHELHTNDIEPPRPTSPFVLNLPSKCFSSANSLGPFPVNLESVIPSQTRLDESGNVLNSLPEIGLPGSASTHPVQAASAESSSRFIAPAEAGQLPLKLQLKRQEIIYHCKFGGFGILEGQFMEPSGVAVNGQNEILVADTLNHRVKIFDREGRFKFQFGKCGRRAPQLLYPNRVAVMSQSGNMVVTERSPSHQIQIFNQYGQFLRKFGATILQHPRGVAVDPLGRVLVVECKVKRVVIFDQDGNLLQKFDCSMHLEFPNGVAVNDRQEIFISDNRGHCVRVFSYAGAYLRQIGGEGLTNYPIGVCLNKAGEVVVADNHNRLNLTVFRQDGLLVNALESKSKYAACFDVALTDDGSAVLACKDYRLYIFRYSQL